MLRGLIKTIRPHQWVKNLFVLAPMFFHKDVFVTGPGGVPALNLLVTGRALVATFVFCLLAGAVYTINDLVDVKADKIHPVKRKRPIPSGEVPLPVARGMAVGLVLISLTVALKGAIIDASCATVGCHVGQFPDGGIDLSTYATAKSASLDGKVLQSIKHELVQTLCHKVAPSFQLMLLKS